MNLWERLKARRADPPPARDRLPLQERFAQLQARKHPLAAREVAPEVHPVVQGNARGRAITQSEINRIVSLPEHTAKPWTGQTHCKRPGLDLRPVQQMALGALHEARGGLFPIGVGHGKTYIALLAGSAMGADLAIVLTPPRTVEQVYQTLAKTDSHFRIPRTEIVSYSTLSLAKASDMLRKLVEGYDESKVVLIADEAHCLKRNTSARTKRVARFLHEHPLVRFVAMSGTMTSKSLKDFAHLSEWALRSGSPIPRPGAAQGGAALEHWSAVMDSDGRASAHDLQWCEPLWQWGKCSPPSVWSATGDERRTGLRQALYRRISSAKGVVATEESSFAASLYLERATVALPPQLVAAMAKVESTKCRPDGEPIESPVDQWRIQRQLSLGFYYRWDWPGGVPDQDWLAARSEWARQVRGQLDHHATEGYDSPLLVFNRIAREYREGQRRAIHKAWYEWSLVKERPAPPVEAVWITGAVLDAALRPVLEDKTPTIIWYSDEAVADALEQRGLCVIRPSKQVPTVAKTCCLSVKSHGTGLNLQAWSQNLVLTPSPSGREWEQLIGRTHRPGQPEDEVWVRVLTHTEAFRDALTSAYRDAEYLQHTTGQAQKLLLACELNTTNGQGKGD